MQPITSPAEHANPSPGPRAAHGRWIWVLSGALTISTVAALGSWAIVRSNRAGDFQEPTTALPTRTVTVTAPVQALNVQSYGAPIKVTTTPSGPVTIAEQISYSSGRPAVTQAVSHGLLTLAAPACAKSDCSVAFSVTVPSGVKVTAAAEGGEVTVVGTGAAAIDSGGGPVYAAGIAGPLTVNAESGGVTVSGVRASADLDSGGGPVTATGIAGKLTVQADGGGVTVSHALTADIDSGGGPVYAAGIGGPLTVNAEGGGVTVNGAAATEIDSGGGPVTASAVNGPLGVKAEGGGVEATGVTGVLTVDSGGGPVSAASLTSPSATVNAEGGGATLSFTTAPTVVQVDTGGANASLSLPGGPYAVNADTGGSTQTVLVPTSSSASRSISVNTEGGELQIGPA